MDFCRIVGSNGVESFDSTGAVSAYPNSWAAVISPDGRYGVGAVELHSVCSLHFTPSHRDTAITRSHHDGNPTASSATFFTLPFPSSSICS